MSGSASFADGGVRLKRIEYDPARWDFVELPFADETAARRWFQLRDGRVPYDLLGNLRFVLGFVPQSRRGRFCSEAIAEALGFPDPWRHGPNGLAAILKYLNRPADAGLFFSRERP